MGNSVHIAEREFKKTITGVKKSNIRVFTRDIVATRHL